MPNTHAPNVIIVLISVMFFFKHLVEDQSILPLKSILLSYIEGDIILDKKVTKELCFSIGHQLNKLTKCVDQISSQFDHLGKFMEYSIWNIKNASQIRHLIPYFDCPSKRNLLTLALNDFEQLVLPKMKYLTQGFIHGDPNDMNTIIGPDEGIYFIDWQHICISYKVYDLAILIFSLVSISLTSSESLDSFSIGKSCLQGYLDHDERSLNAADIDLLPIMVQTRVALSVAVGYCTHKTLNPTNEYLLHTQETGWKILEDLRENREQYFQRWK